MCFVAILDHMEGDRNGASSFMALDWGTKKIGVALADGETRMAFSYEIFDGVPAFFQALDNLVKTRHITNVIVGVPFHAQFADARRDQDVRALGKRISQQYPEITVHFLDEMFTTKMAQQTLREIPRHKMGGDDAEAARILLQEWLDREPTTK